MRMKIMRLPKSAGFTDSLRPALFLTGPELKPAPFPPGGGLAPVVAEAEKDGWFTWKRVLLGCWVLLFGLVVGFCLSGLSRLVVAVDNAGVFGDSVMSTAYWQRGGNVR